VDYPFVDHDEPRDPLVKQAVDAGFFTDERHYGGSYARLRDAIDDEYTARVLDDRLRRRVFELLDAARRTSGEAPLRATAEALLGPIETWLPAFQRYTQGGVTRLVVIPTWQCELRCNYCYIPKQDGRVMSRATLERAIGLLLSSERAHLTLQFFGGEALLEWDLVRHAIEWGTGEAARRGKTLDFVLSSNGWSLDEEKLAWLAGRPVKLELSLDGDPKTQNRFRPALRGDSYQNGIAPRVGAIVASGLRHDVIMVVHPQEIGRLAANYLHVADLGFTRVQINFALGKTWSDAHRKTLAEQLFALAGELRRRPHVTLINAEQPPMPIRLNAEITVDWDGTVYGGNAFLHETEHKSRFRLGHLDDRHAFDRYWMDAPPNAELLGWSYPEDVTRNNLKVGAIMTDFLKWYRASA
jgi:MoaA/NifB/PqqE/SkfB family radical SAM enzyme